MNTIYLKCALIYLKIIIVNFIFVFLGVIFIINGLHELLKLIDSEIPFILYLKIAFGIFLLRTQYTGG